MLGELCGAELTERPSSGGKYVSVSIDVLLASEEQRRRVYEAFHAEKTIRWYV